MKIETFEEVTNGQQERAVQLDGGSEQAEGAQAGEDADAVGDEDEDEDEAKEGEEKVESAKSGTEPEAEEVAVTFGDEKPKEEEHQRAPEWVRKLRKDTAEKSKRIRELEGKLAELSGGEKKPTLGEKPTLENCEYVEAEYEQRLAQYYERKRAVDEAAARAKAEEEEHQHAWKQRLEGYARAKSELKVPDYEESEVAAQEIFSVTQQGILINGSDNPAVLVYALGKDAEKAKKLAAIKDPVKFAFAVAKLETQLKVQPKKQPPPPERIVKGSGRMSGAIDHELERLRDEAGRTGDISKVTAYKLAKRRAEAG